MSKYIVPLEQQKEYNLLVQRANRRIKSSLKFIQQEDIRDFNTQRALVSDYNDKSAWHTEKTVFSRAKVFNSESEYKAYVRHLQQWGAVDKYDRSVDNIRKGYEEAIIKSLTTLAIDNGQGVLTKQGRLPGNIAKKVRSLTLEQLTNFFEHGDPSENIEYTRFNSYDYLGVDRQEFVDITVGRLNALQELFPAKVDTKAKPKPKKRRKAKKKSKKAKKK